MAHVEHAIPGPGRRRDVGGRGPARRSPRPDRPTPGDRNNLCILFFELILRFVICKLQNVMCRLHVIWMTCPVVHRPEGNIYFYMYPPPWGIQTDCRFYSKLVNTSPDLYLIQVLLQYNPERDN